MVHRLTSLLVLAVISHVLAAARGLHLAAVPPPPLAKTSEHLPLAQRAMAFLDASPDPFHAVQASIALLREQGFEELPDGVPFRGRLVRGGKYYYTRHQSTLVAFGIGNRVQSDVPAGFKIIGGHTDSPNLRVKPRSKRSGSGCIQLGVECYGGGLWHTWFDRDLGLSGRVWVRDGATVSPRLVRIDRALLRISNLAIHLQTTKEREAFVVNKEDHLSPILALEVEKALSGGGKIPPSGDGAEEGDNGTDGGTTAEDAAATTDAGPSTAAAASAPANAKDGWTEHQEPALLRVLAHELGVPMESIVDFELNLFDCQRAALGGAYGEFLHSSRLDNLASCFMAVTALAEHVSHGLLDDDADVAMVVLYDHEEVGSASAVGAASPVLGEAVRRISAALHPGDAWVGDDLYRACARQSLVVSSDQAHAVHPNYASKHEKAHQPKMNQGMVVKRNSNQRYATTTATGLVVREVARRAGLLPPQEFMVRQDCGCGSTIGPVISAATGIRAVDVGCPQLSMHSIRETMGVCDLTNGLALFRAFFKHFRAVDDAVQQ